MEYRTQCITVRTSLKNSLFKIENHNYFVEQLQLRISFRMSIFTFRSRNVKHLPILPLTMFLFNRIISYYSISNSKITEKTQKIRINTEKYGKVRKNKR